MYKVNTYILQDILQYAESNFWWINQDIYALIDYLQDALVHQGPMQSHGQLTPRTHSPLLAIYLLEPWHDFASDDLLIFTWRRYDMETFAPLQTLSEENPSITHGLPHTGTTMCILEVVFDIWQNKLLNKITNCGDYFFNACRL